VTRPYVDTSALAKLFFEEAGTSEFVAFATEQPGLAISDLTVIEFRCLVARRQRMKAIDEASGRRVVDRFDDLVRRSILAVHAFGSTEIQEAIQLVERHGVRHGLRTLDALHVACATISGARVFATADRALVAAADAQGFSVMRFD